MITKSFNPWLHFVDVDQFVDYCHAVLRTYCHLTNGKHYIKHGFTSESKTKIDQTVGGCVIPIYILDMIREICRPMYTNTSYAVMCYFPLTSEKGGGLVPGLGWTHAHTTISELLKANFATVETLVPVVEENIGTSPLFISSDRSFAYANGSTCSKSRIDAVNLLRHYRPGTKTHYLAYSNKVTKPGPQSPFETIPGVRLHSISPGFPDARSYDTLDFQECVIYDANGKCHDFMDFMKSHETTNTLVVKSIVVEGTTYYPAEIPIADFHYGVFDATEIHSYFAAIAIKDDELASPLTIRGKLTLGTAFRFDAFRDFTIGQLRFPSNDFPSQGSRSSNTLGKKKRKPRKKKPKPKDNDDEHKDDADDLVDDGLE